ncbi:MAG: hypothetical protein ACD_23C00190G0004, partial [uncultured bacterium]
MLRVIERSNSLSNHRFSQPKNGFYYPNIGTSTPRQAG